MHQGFQRVQSCQLRFLGSCASSRLRRGLQLGAEQITDAGVSCPSPWRQNIFPNWAMALKMRVVNTPNFNDA